jgi:UDP-N-acetylglucosamine transferase subunit ALG13
VIFVAVGTQGSFDRMIRPIDEWAVRNDRDDVFAQIGRDAWRPTRIQWVEHLDAKEFRSRVERADVVISHAGMGTILTALELRKPVLIMPRRAALLEQRNDHQLATAKKLEEMGLATVAHDERELAERLQSLNQLKVMHQERGTEQLDRLLDTLRRFLSAGPQG